MEPLDMGPVYEEIGRIAVDETGGVPDGLLIYMEIEKDVVTCIILKESKERVVNRLCSPELTGTIFDAWESLAGKHRWASMNYTVTNSHFDVQLEYPDNWKKGETFVIRASRAITARFGDKPVKSIVR